jgi:hypothetical protein
MPAKSVPWVELYRPKALDQVSHQVEVVATLQSAVKTGQLPHLLLVGIVFYFILFVVVYNTALSFFSDPFCLFVRRRCFVLLHSMDLQEVEKHRWHWPCANSCIIPRC